MEAITGGAKSGAELDRRIAALAIPALGSIAAEPLYNLADTAIVGHLGRTPLDALAIANAALMLASWVAIFLSMATTSTVAIRRAREPAGAGRAAGAAYIIAVAGGVLVALIVVAAAPAAARLLGGAGDNSKTVQGAIEYLRISAIGVPFLYVSYAGNGHLVGLADTRSPLRIAVGANALNIALETALVYGAHWGLRGSAWGTVIAQIAAAGWYFATSRKAAIAPGRPGEQEIRTLLRAGQQLSVRTIALGVVPLTTTAIAARLGPVALGGQQIAMRVWYLLSILLDALAVPAQVYVSSALGADDHEHARLVGHRSLRLGLLAGLALTVVTAALAPVVPAVFTHDPAVRHAAMVALAVSSLTQPLAALAFVYDGLILGIADYKAMRLAMLLAVLAYVPMAALTIRFHWLGLPGIWVALGCWLAARTGILARRWARYVRQPDTRPA
ncbi:MAG TPA: MATE family efflux transporter [Streptosporangiaceae bacterium]